MAATLLLLFLTLSGCFPMATDYIGNTCKEPCRFQLKVSNRREAGTFARESVPVFRAISVRFA